MNIDDKIQKIFFEESTSLNAQNFLDKLYLARETQARRSRKLTFGIHRWLLCC